MKSSLIKKEAKEVKGFVESNKALPKYCTINNNQYSPYTTAYLFAKVINTPKASDIKVVNIKAPNNTFKQESINEKVKIADYMDMVKRFVKYCEENKKAPAYVMTGKRKVGFALFAYCLAKIVNYYQMNKAMPNYCIMNSKDLSNAGSSAQNNASNSASGNKNSSSSTLSRGYLTTKGCAGMGQCTAYYCACNSIQQCIYKLTGKVIPESTIAKWAGTTHSGTDHMGIETAIAKFNKTYGYKLKVSWKNFSDLGNSISARFNALDKLIKSSNTAVFCHLLYRNKYGHYEVPQAVNTKDSTLKILNSLGERCNYPAYCGYIETRSFSEQARYIGGISQKSICIIKK